MRGGTVLSPAHQTSHADCDSDTRPAMSTLGQEAHKPSLGSSPVLHPISWPHLAAEPPGSGWICESPRLHQLLIGANKRIRLLREPTIFPAIEIAAAHPRQRSGQTTLSSSASLAVRALEVILQVILPVDLNPASAGSMLLGVFLQVGWAGRLLPLV